MHSLTDALLVFILMVVVIGGWAALGSGLGEVLGMRQLSPEERLREELKRRKRER